MSATKGYKQMPAQESLRFPLLSVLMDAYKEGRRWRFEESWRGVFIWWIGSQPKKLASTVRGTNAGRGNVQSPVRGRQSKVQAPRGA